jgi:hypothetical protein
MKNIIVLIVIGFSLIACSNDDDANSADAELVGTWKLVSIYSDPGDGSGDFVAVSSDKTITFNADGTLNSNANLCLLFSETGESSSGTYSETEGSFTITDCETMPVTANFELIDSDLIISYFCIEGCQEKYEKVE